MRKLASIQKIRNLEPIKDADNIEKATVLGWELVVKKGDFNVGDLCVYIEIDSVLPEKDWSEFLRPRNFRIKTIRLKGQVSQGIALPLSILPNADRPMKWGYVEGADVTEILGVVKYESPTEKNERLNQESKNVLLNTKIGNYLKRYSWFRKLIYRPSRDKFPTFIKKTDEDRIQLFPDICQRHKETSFVVTEKLDGSSATYFIIRNPKKWQFWKPYIFGVCSRNFQLLEKNNVWWKVAIEQNIKNKLIKYATDHALDTVVIQGEIIGENIQGNKYQLKGHHLFLFNIIQNGIKSNYITLDWFCQLTDMQYCPVLYEGYTLATTIHDEVKRAKGCSLVGIKPKREGVVIRNYDKDISFKVINPDFLITFDE